MTVKRLLFITRMKREYALLSAETETINKATLEKILRQRNIGAGTFIRAKILLLKSGNHSNEYIADKLDITVPTVRLCIDKYNAGGIENALKDSKGRGRKSEITDADITWVISKACEKPKDHGLII